MNRRPFVRKGFSCHTGYIPLVFLAAAFLTAALWYIALHGLVRKLTVPNSSRRDIFYNNGDGSHHADATHAHPQIALLFLARGELPTEPLWEMWLRDAEGLRPWQQQLQQLGVSMPEAEREPLQQQLGRELLPALAVNVTQRNSECWANGGVVVRNNPLTHAHEQEAVRELPRARRGGGAALRGQQLFTVYVHTHPKHPGFPEGSMFRGREVAGRVEVQLAQHSVLEAERLLFRAALKDARNAKFVLLSESCVPLRPPALIYTQLLLEPTSRVDACADKPEEQLDLYRWTDLMATPALQRSSWRKSAQWVVLNAKHAALVVQDRHVDAMFSSFCATKPICHRPRKAHVCVSDESYIPTLLAVYGLDNETDCTGWGTYADWSRPYWHPKEFESADVSLQLLRTARDAAACSWAGPLQLAHALFPHSGLPPGPPAPPLRAAPADWQQLLLPGTCPLFARKFGPAAVHQLLLSEAASSCHGLALLNRTCSAEDLA